MYKGMGPETKLFKNYIKNRVKVLKTKKLKLLPDFKRKCKK